MQIHGLGILQFNQLIYYTRDTNRPKIGGQLLTLWFKSARFEGPRKNSHLYVFRSLEFSAARIFLTSSVDT